MHYSTLTARSYILVCTGYVFCGTLYSGMILEHTDMSKQNHNLISLKDQMFLWENKGRVLFHQTELALNVT